MLSLFKRGHQARGNECRYATFFPASSGFEEDICLRLPLMSDSKLVQRVKSWIYKDTPEMQGQADREGYPPVWRTNTAAEAVFFFLRDLIQSPKINSAIREHRLDRYDVYHLDQGLDFYRNGKFIRRMKARGARIVCFYNGTDLRNRGVIPEVDAISDLNLTSELDLVQKHPNIKYLHLPFDVDRFEPKGYENDPLIIGHTCRGPQARHFKGTDRVIEVVQELERSHGIEFDLVEGVPHKEAMRRKATWDIAVDQIADAGGWGYGVNSLESLSMGIPTCTRMRPECDEFFRDHPFINVEFDNLKEKLIELIEDPKYRRRKGEEGRAWVRNTHHLDTVLDHLYSYYAEAGINI
jgi:glycosyltransferase involved in cell wall biosynthesis